MTKHELTQAKRFRYLVLLAGCAMLPGLSIDMYLPAIPELVADLGGTADLGSMTMSVFLGAVALGQIVFGPLSDRIGRRPPILYGLLLYLFGSLLATLSSSMSMLLVARVFQALGACAAAVVGRSVVRDLFDFRESASCFSLMSMLAALVAVIAPIIGAGLLLFSSWRSIFTLLAIIGVALGLWCFRYLEETRSDATALQARDEHPVKSYAALLRQQRLLGYLLAGAFNSGAFFTYLAMSPVVIMEVFGLSPTVFGVIFAVNGVGLISASQFNRYLLKTRTPDSVLKNSAKNAIILALVFVATVAFPIGGLPVLLVLLLTVVASVSIVQANTVAGALSVDAQRSGSASALFGAASFAMGMLFSLLAGWMYDGSERALISVIAICLLGTAFSIKFLVKPAESLVLEP